MAAGLRLLGDARRDDRRHRRHGAVYRPSPTGGKRAGRRPAPEVASLPPRRPQPVAAADARARPPSVHCGRGSPLFPAGCFAASPAQPVLWPSLDCWQAHPAVDLGAASGETAVCMRDGVVLSCVRMISGAGTWPFARRTARSAPIRGCPARSCRPVKSVVRGQPLGDVIAAVPAESELGAHLHLPFIETARQPNPRCPIDFSKFSNFTNSSKRTFEIHQMMVY